MSLESWFLIILPECVADLRVSLLLAFIAFALAEDVPHSAQEAPLGLSHPTHWIDPDPSIERKTTHTSHQATVLERRAVRRTFDGRITLHKLSELAGRSTLRRWILSRSDRFLRQKSLIFF